GSLRFTFGRYNTIEDTDAIIEAIKEIVEQLRAISPLYENK
ncbi:MAG: cysteine desulfurase NifS, partial [Methanolobus sp.]|nr:cysteine desulfurase NifS [Methanolobus sp.]